MCGQHNKEKGQLPLEDFRTKLQLDEFFASGDKLTLRDLLQYLKKTGAISNFGAGVVVTEQGDTAVVDSAEGKTTYSLYRCPITGWRYFYATLDASIIDSDDEADDKAGLQPRYLI